MKVTVIGICGGSSAGKTLLATQLNRYLQDDSVLISQDDYYRDFSEIDVREKAKLNLDCPEAIENELLIEHLQHLMNGNSVAVPYYDLRNTKRFGYRPLIVCKRFLILEGLFLFCIPELLRILNFKCFVDAEEEIRIRRITERDVSERGQTLETVCEQITKFILPMHGIYLEPYRNMADIIIPNHDNDRYRLATAAEQLANKIRALFGCGCRSVP